MHTIYVMVHKSIIIMTDQLKADRSLTSMADSDSDQFCFLFSCSEEMHSCTLVFFQWKIEK